MIKKFCYLSNQNKINSIRKNKLLKSDKSNNNIDSINYNKKKTEIKRKKMILIFPKI